MAAIVGLGHVLQEGRNVVAESAPLLGAVDGEPTHVLDVGARDERALAGAGENDHADVAVVAQPLQLPA